MQLHKMDIFHIALYLSTAHLATEIAHLWAVPPRLKNTNLTNRKPSYMSDDSTSQLVAFAVFTLSTLLLT